MGGDEDADMARAGIGRCRGSDRHHQREGMHMEQDMVGVAKGTPLCTAKGIGLCAN